MHAVTLLTCTSYLQHRTCTRSSSAGLSPRPSFSIWRSFFQSLFPRLVLGWIEADFRVQIRILQHFSKSTRKSPSREQILQISAKKLEIFAKILTFFGKFCKILQNFQKSAKILQNFAVFLQNFTEIHRFEKCCKMLCWMQNFLPLDFDKLGCKILWNFS